MGIWASDDWDEGRIRKSEGGNTEARWDCVWFIPVRHIEQGEGGREGRRGSPSISPLQQTLKVLSAAFCFLDICACFAKKENVVLRTYETRCKIWIPLLRSVTYVECTGASKWRESVAQINVSPDFAFLSFPFSGKSAARDIA